MTWGLCATVFRAQLACDLLRRHSTHRDHLLTRSSLQSRSTHERHSSMDCARTQPIGATPQGTSRRGLPLSGNFRPGVDLRWYQQDAVTAAQQASTASVIVMPCGSGKTLVCVALALDVIRTTDGFGDVLMLCPNETAVHNLSVTIANVTDIPSSRIFHIVTASKARPLPTDYSVWITSYSFLKEGASAVDSDSPRAIAVKWPSSNLSVTAREARKFMRTVSWKGIIADEVHRTAASELQVMMHQLRHESSRQLKGLTATFNRNLRSEIGILHNLFSDVTYRVGWDELVRAGHLSPVRCTRMIVPWDEQMQNAYAALPDRRLMLTQLNSVSLICIYRLVRRHAQHRILVFAQSIVVLDLLAKMLRCPQITGDTPHDLRTLHVEAFKQIVPGVSPYHVLVCSEVSDECFFLSTCIQRRSSHAIRSPMCRCSMRQSTCR